ncbi:glycoside hydrolase family 35 protein [Staphylococcus simulans]|uniref:glycoside hydrolase family 35 protein n=1 Tax=Staphylococcus simulans TaxID=1286 RepID=UPI001E3D0865|nr:beta-galactosidase [Staphylococcus simulans]
MGQFTVEQEFMLDGKPLKILSGAIHYFRLLPKDYEHSLYNLKALGFNAVETYIPWNFHETVEGVFDFSGTKDLKRFIQTAADIGLYVIVRPSPYICAEWEFGGLPAWLLNKNVRVRSRDQNFLDYVARYYDRLFEILVPLQIDHHGPILMMQVENEYGSYGEDKVYLHALAELMRNRGVTVPLFTSDGSWQQCLEAGSLAEEGILPTGNFGSKSVKRLNNLKQFHKQFHQQWPLMSMEFWDGWFNRWGDRMITRQSDELINEIKEAIQLGSINLYMFHGGTNFGFWNGCSARGRIDLPQVTSYDYDAPLNEAGNPTEKYFKIQRLIKSRFPELEQSEPRVKPLMKIDEIKLKSKVSLFSILNDISHYSQSFYPEAMEKAGSGYGYMVYRTTLKTATRQEYLRIVDARDRVQLFLDNEKVYTAYQEAIGEKFEVALKQPTVQADILVENMGRVNYGYKLTAPTQRKGIGQGLMQDLHFVQNWEQFDIDFDLLTSEHFEQEWQAEQPGFYRYQFIVDIPQSTYIDVSDFGKGIVLVNGFNIGRYWDIGPTLSLYIPGALLKQGMNTIVVFETEGKYADKISLLQAPKYISS